MTQKTNEELDAEAMEVLKGIATTACYDKDPQVRKTYMEIAESMRIKAFGE